MRCHSSLSIGWRVIVKRVRAIALTIFSIIEELKHLEMVVLQPDPFLNELTSMFERSIEKGSVWVTLKRSSMKSKATRNKMESTGQPIEYRCLVRATDGKKNISTSLSAKDYLKFQSSYATVLKAHMHALKKRERRDKKKTIEPDQKQAPSSKSKSSKKASSSASKAAQ